MNLIRLLKSVHLITLCIAQASILSFMLAMYLAATLAPGPPEVQHRVTLRPATAEEREQWQINRLREAMREERERHAAETL